MGAAILSDLLTEVLIPVAAVVGIAFALVQWVLVSKVKLTPGAAQPSGSAGNKNGYGDYLIEEEEGLNEHNVVVKCADIQNAISEEGFFLSSQSICLLLSSPASSFSSIPRHHGRQPVFLLSHHLQPFREAGSDRVCSDGRRIQPDVPRDQRCKRFSC